ncbi:MAG: hypothetical protein ACFFAU_00850 [Candidatus Hodarchaeota archaeon]
MLVNTVSKKRMKILGIVGFKNGALKLTQLWTRKNSKEYFLEKNERIYLLDKVNPRSLGKNNFEQATKSEKKLICEWNKAFIWKYSPILQHQKLRMFENE